MVTLILDPHTMPSFSHSLFLALTSALSNIQIKTPGFSWFALVLFLPILSCVIGAKHITKFTILTTVPFSGIKYIHTVVQP